MMSDRNVLIVIGIMLVVFLACISYAAFRPSHSDDHESEKMIVAIAHAESSTTSPDVYKVSIAPKMLTDAALVSVSAPAISALIPGSGVPGTVVTVEGSGFQSSSNRIFFGSTHGTFYANGRPSNQIEEATSSDGTTLTFVVPASSPSGLLCDQSGCVATAPTDLDSGFYPITITNTAGTSNTVEFYVTR